MPGRRNESSSQPEPFARVDAGGGAILGGVLSKVSMMTCIILYLYVYIKVYIYVCICNVYIYIYMYML